MKTNIKVLLKELKDTEFKKLSEAEINNLWDWFTESKLDKENIRDKESIKRFITWLER